jgi:hypothetical protein
MIRNHIKITIPILAILLVSFVTFNCEKIVDLITFTISNEVTIQIPSSTALNLPVGIPTPDVTTDSEQTFENHNTRASLVKDVKLSEVKLTITNPQGRTFSFLKSIHIYISTGQNNEILLAHLEEVPANVNNIVLIPTKERLDEYVKAASYKLRTSIVHDEMLTQDVDVRADLKFKVTAAPL